MRVAVRESSGLIVSNKPDRLAMKDKRQRNESVCPIGPGYAEGQQLLFRDHVARRVHCRLYCESVGASTDHLAEHE